MDTCFGKLGTNGVAGCESPFRALSLYRTRAPVRAEPVEAWVSNAPLWQALGRTVRVDRKPLQARSHPQSSPQRKLASPCGGEIPAFAGMTGGGGAQHHRHGLADPIVVNPLKKAAVPANATFPRKVAGAGEGTAPSPCAGPSWDARSTGPGRSRKRVLVVCAVRFWSRSEGWLMDGAFEDECDDHPCPICRGEVSDEFIAMIERAAAQPGQVMIFDEAKAWLRGL